MTSHCFDVGRTSVHAEETTSGFVVEKSTGVEKVTQSPVVEEAVMVDICVAAARATNHNEDEEDTGPNSPMKSILEVFMELKTRKWR